MEIISRAEAKAKGLTRYFTGKPCKHGHVAERVSSGRCAECNRIALANVYETNKEKALARQKAYRDSNPEKVKARRKVYYEDNREKLLVSSKLWQKNNPEKAAANTREWKYRLPDEYLKQMLINQGGCCRSCGTKISFEGGVRKDKACVDHCHDTHVVVGIACGSCNTSRGMLKEARDRMLKLAAYQEYINENHQALLEEQLKIALPGSPLLKHKHDTDQPLTPINQ